MPKENINSTSTSDEGDPVTRVEVSWFAGRSVDVGVACLADPDPELPSGIFNQATFVHLGRDGINRLIRVLRRARDAAYGADA